MAKRKSSARAGKPTIEHRPIIGPTLERLSKAESHYVIGDDKRGGKLYHFHDDSLSKVYARLVKAARTRHDEDNLRREYTALMKYKHHWINAGKEPTISSVDPNNIFSSNPSQRSGMPMAAFQTDHDKQWRLARKALEHKAGIIVDNVVLHENHIEIAGYAVGYESRTQARDKAVEMLRHSGQVLAKLWGVG